jgi:hypothetical protein
MIRDYDGRVEWIGHSRGGPKSLVGAWYSINRLGAEIPQRVLPYCSPAVFNRHTAELYDAIPGLKAVTLRLTMHHDPINEIAFPWVPLIHHVGIEVTMPDVQTTAIKKHGLVGEIFYGHAYSSVMETLIEWCKKHGTTAEQQFLKDRMWVCTI